MSSVGRSATAAASGDPSGHVMEEKGTVAI